MRTVFQKTPLLLAIIFLTLFGFVVIFLYQKINNNNKTATENMAKWQEETRRRDNITSLHRTLQKISDDRTKLETHFAKSSDVVPFLDTLEKLAPEVGAVAQVSSVDTVEKNTELLIGLKATGSFESLYKFLTLLENSPYELEFISMDIRKLASSDPLVKYDPRWEATFKIRLLSFIP